MNVLCGSKVTHVIFPDGDSVSFKHKKLVMWNLVQLRLIHAPSDAVVYCLVVFWIGGVSWLEYFQLTNLNSIPNPSTPRNSDQHFFKTCFLWCHCFVYMYVLIKWSSPCSVFKAFYVESLRYALRLSRKYAHTSRNHVSNYVVESICIYMYTIHSGIYVWETLCLLLSLGGPLSFLVSFTHAGCWITSRTPFPNFCPLANFPKWGLRISLYWYPTDMTLFLWSVFIYLLRPRITVFDVDFPIRNY